MKRMQNELIEEQDQHLDEINEIANRLKVQGKEINREIDNQGRYIGELNEEMDKNRPYGLLGKPFPWKNSALVHQYSKDFFHVKISFKVENYRGHYQ